MLAPVSDLAVQEAGYRTTLVSDSWYPTTYFFEPWLLEFASILEENEPSFSRKRLGVTGESLYPDGRYTAALHNASIKQTSLSEDYISRIFKTTNMLMSHKRYENIHIRRYSGVAPCPASKLAKENRDFFMTRYPMSKTGLGFAEAFIRLENKLKVGKQFISIDNGVRTFTTSAPNIRSTYSKYLVKQRPRAFIEMSALNLHLSALHQAHKAYVVGDSAYKHEFIPPLNLAYNNNRLAKAEKIEVLDIVSQDRRFKKEAMHNVVLASMNKFCDLFDLEDKYKRYLLDLSLSLIMSPLIIRDDKKQIVGAIELNFWPSGLFCTTLGNLVGSTIECEDALDFRQETLDYSISSSFYSKRRYNIGLFGDNVLIYGKEAEVNKAVDQLKKHKPTLYHDDGSEAFYDQADTFLGMMPVRISSRMMLVQNPCKLIELFSPEHGIFDSDRQGYFKPNLAAGFAARYESFKILKEMERFRYLNKIDYDFTSFFSRNSGEIDRKQEFINGQERDVYNEKYWLTYGHNLADIIIDNFKKSIDGYI